MRAYWSWIAICCMGLFLLGVVVWATPLATVTGKHTQTWTNPITGQVFTASSADQTLTILERPKAVGAPTSAVAGEVKTITVLADGSSEYASELSLWLYGGAYVAGSLTGATFVSTDATSVKVKLLVLATPTTVTITYKVQF